VSLGRIKDTKTHERRYVDVSDGLVSRLAEYVEFVKAEAVAANQPEPYWLFPSREGGLVTEADERWHRDLFKQVLSVAQLPGFVPYDLRHTYASLLLSQNVPLPTSPSNWAMPNRPRRWIITRSGYPVGNNDL
jgi:integrase